MTFPLTSKHLQAAGLSPGEAVKWLAPLNDAMIEGAIITAERPAMFLAQVAHESGGFHYLAELWGPTPQQLRYDAPGDSLAQSLGNVPGSGFLWRGHGLIQITGYLNHKAVALRFKMPVEDTPAWLMTPVGACRGAAHFWVSHGCNALADAYDFVAVTKRINGGLNGLPDRLERYKRICAAMA